MISQQEIDEVDRKILLALLKDARCNFADIAKDCQVSIPAITQRYKKMKENGIIIGTTLIINTEKSKNQHSLSIDIKAESKCELDIVKVIKKLPGVLNCNRVVGKYDIHAGIRANSMEEIDQIRNIIRKEKGVLSIEITPSIDTLFFYPENLLKIFTEDSNIG